MKQVAPARWPLLLSDKEAGEYLGISRSLVREYIAAGRITRVMLRHPSGYGYVNRLLIHREELERFAQAQENSKSKT
jgi:excisionase family DNA binding protein